MSDGFYDDERFERPSFKRARRSDADTSKRAIDNRKAASVRKAIFAAMQALGQPATAEEICRKAGIDGQTGNPRFNELMEMGWICKTGEQGTNLSGKEADLWRIATPEEGAFLRSQCRGGFPADNALVDELHATPDILDKIWPFLNRKQKRAYNGQIGKDNWNKYKKKGIVEHMLAFADEDE